MEHSESKMKQSHREKYEALAHVVGIEDLKKIIFFHGTTPDRINKALAGGDEHLNTIPLRVWDQMALSTGEADSDAPKGPPIRFEYPWTKLKEPQSLAMRVCMLKYVAKHYIAARSEQ